MFNCIVGWVWWCYVPLETQTVVILASVRYSLEAHIFLGYHVKSDSLNKICDFLVQGSMFNTWKPMWVVLLEDGIEFYKRKADNSPKGMIPLKGSSIHSPCQDFGKRMVSTFLIKRIHSILLEALKRQKADGCKFLALTLVAAFTRLRISQAGLELCTTVIQDTSRGLIQKVFGGSVGWFLLNFWVSQRAELGVKTFCSWMATTPVLNINLIATVLSWGKILCEQEKHLFIVKEQLACSDRKEINAVTY